MSGVRSSLIVAALIGFALAAAAEDLPADGPRHVMSLSMCTDELLLELLPTDRIASVTYYAHKPDNVYLWPQAARIASNSGSAEEVLVAHPDLVLVGTFTTPATRRLLDDMHYAVLEVPPANDFEAIRRITRRVAHALHRDTVAEALLARMDATLASLSQNPMPRAIHVAVWGEGGSIPGRGTLFDAILRAAGGINAAPSNSGRSFASFDIEQLLAARPEVIAYPRDIGATPGRNTELALHPLIMKLYARKRIAFSSALYSCGTPASAEAARSLQQALESVAGVGS